MVGRRRALELVLLGVLGRGHVLLEDVPGLGKTMMARCFSEALGLSFRRVQFTPDLLPADITGISVFDPGTSRFDFRPGPVFTQLLLADEINRTPPKTQAALLEAMAEEQVSSDGETRPLPQPFVVLATDNPIEYEGTYALPEAQLDRFLLRVSLGYLGMDDEQELLQRRLRHGWAPPTLSPVVDADTVVAMRESLELVQVEASVLRYVVSLVHASRTHPQVTLGASPRGGLALVALARGQAVLERPRLRDARGRQGGGGAGAGPPDLAAPRALGTPGHLAPTSSRTCSARSRSRAEDGPRPDPPGLRPDRAAAAAGDGGRAGRGHGRGHLARRAARRGGGAAGPARGGAAVRRTGCRGGVGVHVHHPLRGGRRGRAGPDGAGRRVRPGPGRAGGAALVRADLPGHEPGGARDGGPVDAGARALGPAPGGAGPAAGARRRRGVPGPGRGRGR